MTRVDLEGIPCIVQRVRRKIHCSEIDYFDGESTVIYNWDLPSRIQKLPLTHFQRLSWTETIAIQKWIDRRL